jgi:hypothetical protein
MFQVTIKKLESRYREGSSKKEQQLIKDATRAMKKNGICSFPDQAELEDLEWLVSRKELFSSQVKIVKDEFDRIINIWKQKETATTISPKGMQEYLLQLHTGFYNQYGIETMYPTTIDSIKDLDHVDLRFSQLVFVRSLPAGQLNRPKPKDSLQPTQVQELCDKLSFNISHVLPEHERDLNPQIDQIGFMAWGTNVQESHCDYFVKGKGGHKYPDNVEGKEFWGNFMYVFNDKEDLEKKIAPTLMIAHDPKLHHKEQTPHSIQQKFCCLFSASTRHAGGMNNHPCIRFHVLLDPSPHSKIKQVKTDHGVYNDAKTPKNQDYDTLRMRRNRAKQYAAIPLKKPKILENFYKELSDKKPAPKNTTAKDPPVSKKTTAKIQRHYKK